MDKGLQDQSVRSSNPDARIQHRDGKGLTLARRSLLFIRTRRPMLMTQLPAILLKDGARFRGHSRRRCTS